MKIGIDARLWKETGVGRYINNLVEQLQLIDKKNSYVLFVTHETDMEFKATDRNFPNNWKIVSTDIRWHTLREQLMFPSLLEKEKLDLVHFPYFSVPIFYKKPYVITIHDLIVHHYPTGKASTLPLPLYYLKRLGYKYIIQHAARNAQHILTVSQATKREIAKHLGISENKIIVTYEGVDPRLHSSKIQSSDSKYAKEKYFLYVGNAYPHKNLEYLLDAFANVYKAYPDIKLILVGQINYFYKQLRKYAKAKNLLDAVVFYGNAKDAELQVLYKHAQALIFPSLMEGFGLPGLEAMQSKQLVLASDIPVFREIYQDAAVYFDPKKPESVQQVMIQVLQKRDAYEPYRVRGKKIVEAFSWETLAKQTVKVYESSTGIRQS